MDYLFWAVFKMAAIEIWKSRFVPRCKAVRVTKLVSMHMFLGVRNSIMPIKNVSVFWKIYKPLFKRIFRTFLVIFCVSLWDREGYCAPSTHESLRPIFLAHKTSPNIKSRCHQIQVGCTTYFRPF